MASASSAVPTAAPLSSRRSTLWISSLSSPVRAAPPPPTAAATWPLCRAAASGCTTAQAGSSRCARAGPPAPLGLAHPHVPASASLRRSLAPPQAASRMSQACTPLTPACPKHACRGLLPDRPATTLTHDIHRFLHRFRAVACPAPHCPSSCQLRLLRGSLLFQHLPPRRPRGSCSRVCTLVRNPCPARAESSLGAAGLLPVLHSAEPQPIASPQCAHIFCQSCHLACRPTSHVVPHALHASGLSLECRQVRLWTD